MKPKKVNNTQLIYYGKIEIEGKRDERGGNANSKYL